MPCRKRLKTYRSIFIGFNIQVFGPSKASKPEVMEVLASIISQFDIVAIQEIRDKSGKVIKIFF